MVPIIATVCPLTILASYALQWHSRDKLHYSLIILFRKKLIPLWSNFSFCPWSISTVPRRNHLVNASSLLQFPTIQGSWDSNICEISNGFFMPMESKKKKKFLLWWCFQMSLMLHIWQEPFFSNKLRFSKNHTRQLKCDRPWNLPIDWLYLKHIYIPDNQYNYANTYMRDFTQS